MCIRDRCYTAKEIEHLDMSFNPVACFLIHVCFYKSILAVSQYLDLGWDLLSLLPKDALDRIDSTLLDRYYDPKRADRFKEIVKEHLNA